ncbi:MAG: hypothetical protein DWQ04_10825 [Chloroflexi bacterium]|nr:MAG: hypothetical protein DWQ04_10825 [Chloroflexota bacterium]
MRRRIEKYAIFYNVAANEGHILFQLDDNIEGQGTATLLLDSPQEGMLVLDILRNEQPVYYDEDHQIIMTGLEFTGEGEE